MKRIAGMLMSLLVCATGGCGSAESPPGSAGLDDDPLQSHTGGSSSSPGAAGIGGSGSGNDANLGGSGSGNDTNPDAGSDEAPPVAISDVIRDVPGAPCTATTASPLALLEAGPLGLTFDRAGSSGERRFALDSGSLALVTFAPAGTQAEPSPSGNVLAATASAAGLSTLMLDDAGHLVMSFLDTFGAARAASIELDGAGTDHHALFAGPEASLAVWRLDSELKGVVIASDGARQPIAFGADSCGEHGCKPVVLAGEQGFTLLWSRVLHNGLSALSWAALRPDGTTINIKTLLASRESYRLVDATRLGDQGVALVLSEGFPDRAPILVFLDPFGEVRAPAHRLLGAVEPWGIASQGEGVALVARSSEEQAVFGTFSESGDPSSSWSCLDDSEKNSAFAPRAALFTEGEGYGILVRRTDGSAAYLRVDELGSAIP
jgi:hypothetical protein